jgi:hypothetical protein
MAAIVSIPRLFVVPIRILFVVEILTSVCSWPISDMRSRITSCWTRSAIRRQVAKSKGRRDESDVKSLK